MEFTVPKYYIIDENGNEQQVEIAKMRIEFQDGNNVTIKVGVCNPERSQQIVMFGHRGKEEEQIDDKYGVLLNISPASGNVIFVKPVTFERIGNTLE